MKQRTVCYCQRCEGVYVVPDNTNQTVCRFCGFGSVLNFKVSGNAGTARTGTSHMDTTAATSCTVT